MSLSVFLTESYHCCLSWTWPAEGSVNSGCQGKIWILIAELPLSDCVTLGKLLNLSEQRFCKKGIMILTSMSCCEDQWETVHEMLGQMRSLVGKAGGSCYCQWVMLGHFPAGQLCTFLGLPGAAETLRERLVSPRLGGGRATDGDLCAAGVLPLWISN